MWDSEMGRRMKDWTGGDTMEKWNWVGREGGKEGPERFVLENKKQREKVSMAFLW